MPSENQSTVSDQVSQDIKGPFPLEIWYVIFEHMPLEDFWNFRLISKYFLGIVRGRYIAAMDSTKETIGEAMTLIDQADTMHIKQDDNTYVTFEKLPEHKEIVKTALDQIIERAKKPINAIATAYHKPSCRFLFKAGPFDLNSTDGRSRARLASYSPVLSICDLLNQDKNNKGSIETFLNLCYVHCVEFPERDAGLFLIYVNVFLKSKSIRCDFIGKMAEDDRMNRTAEIRLHGQD